MNLLLAEDDRDIAMGLEYTLQKEGFTVTVCTGVKEAQAAFTAGDFSIAVLDLSLSDGSGYDICRFIKSAADIPVIFLTARDDEMSVVMGLDMGADDYITKPFRIRELLSRIKTVLRRYNRADGSRGVYRFGSVEVDTNQAKVYKNAAEVLLTALEYRLFLIFIQNEGQVLSRTQLLENIWDVSGDFVNDNTLTVYIKRLREKIEDDPQNPALIKTVRGLGYML